MNIYNLHFYWLLLKDIKSLKWRKSWILEFIIISCNISWIKRIINSMNVFGNRLNSWKMLKLLSFTFILIILFDLFQKSIISMMHIYHHHNYHHYHWYIILSLSSLWLLLLSSIYHLNNDILQSFILLLSIYHSMKFYSLSISLFFFISFILIILFHIIISNLTKLDHWRENILSWIYNSNSFLQLNSKNDYF